ncbi:Uncharacterised protein [Slackia heliotrinireducens]|uniref:Multidrug transporter n=1 Tax=Slackia heliotrinireducens (strain ATCC 29202 / DSM 20476 / NCTC 11029 / RHS 1) TaxID=471855 RepID=C7N343_SLAHD|nr:hypothetical protein [Slackia heliotrinireducens]ACV21564.1 hypothetical protein Shel_05040 [Slackia heliotrinireducens DSM 20476]VEG99067.1 Uncharacterised protein [Slackia heliotrinireducens]
MYKPKESDWKLLRKNLPDWQEACMDKLLKEYAQIIAKDSLPSERWWELEKRVRKDKRNSGVIVEGLSRSKLLSILQNLYADGVIGDEDLKEFSDELQETMRTWANLGR